MKSEKRKMKNPLLFTMILIGLALTAVAQQPNGFYADPNNPYGLSREVLSGPPHLPQVVGTPQAAGLKSDPLYGGILVSDGGLGDNSIQYGNSSRNIAVGPEGNIYAVYRSASGGIRVARSTNRGESFLPSVQVHGTAHEAEIAVSRNGTVYVVWATAGIAYVSRSLDGGASFETPVNAGPAFDNNIRAATDGNEVFLVDARGMSVLSSSNNGQSFDQFNLGASQAFADIHVDRKTGEVIVFADNPTVKYYTSTDRGASFGPPTNPRPGGDVYYSSTAYSSGARGRFAFIAGFPESATK